MATSRKHPFSLTTDALDENHFFDARYTYGADNSSPELHWNDPPDAASQVEAFALLAEDIDAEGGGFTHWIIYNIPASIHHLPAGIPAQENLPNGIRQGLNGFGKLGYVGPAPPTGNGAHHYRFKLYALSKRPEIPGRASRDSVLQAIAPFILATTELEGMYHRPARRAG